MSLSDKANENYTIACLALESKKYNAAASRLYYALYQACVKTHMNNKRSVSSFMSVGEEKRRQERLGSKTDAPKWPHDILISSNSLYDLGLDATQRATVRTARDLRVKGDYGDNDKVSRGELEILMEHAKGVFKQLGVSITNNSGVKS